MPEPEVPQMSPGLTLWVTVGLMAAGILVIALLIDGTLRRYAIVAPAPRPAAKPVVEEDAA